MSRVLPIVFAAVMLASCAASTSRPPQVSVPADECPDVLLIRTGGLGDESRSGVVAAVWRSGVIVRAESPKRPWGRHVAGRLSRADLDALLEAVKSSPIWNEPSGNVALDMADEELTLQRDGERRRWVETPDVTSTPFLADFRDRLVSLRIEQMGRTNQHFDGIRHCPR